MSRGGATVAATGLAALLLGTASAASLPKNEIAYTRYLPRGTGIFVMATDGSRQRRLVRDAGDAGDASFSPDGRMLVFASFAADGTQGLYVARVSGGGVRRLTAHRYDPTKPLLDAHPRWAPDGRRIAFHRARGSGIDSDVYLIGVDGRGIRRVTRGYEPSWRPDGKELAFAFRSTLRTGYDLYLIGADGRGRRRLTSTRASDTEPDWSPDGKRIAFVRQLLDNYEIFAVEARGGRERRLTRNPAVDTAPDWSPDGSWILFASRRVQHQFDIYAMRADGTALTRLTTSRDDEALPTWKP